MGHWATILVHVHLREASAPDDEVFTARVEMEQRGGGGNGDSVGSRDHSPADLRLTRALASRGVRPLPLALA